MKIRLAAALVMLTAMAAFAHGQKTIVVADPTVTEKETKLSDSDQTLVDRVALPKFRKKYQSDVCDVKLDIAGAASGAFTRVGAQQRLAFFQVCQTGNGLGIVGLVLIENGKVIGTFGADSGWTVGIELLPDINANGLSEFTLSYGGGMHQGQGGVGIDIMEFSGSTPVGIGWFKAEEIMDTDAVNVWKVTAKPGKSPVYYKQKYRSVGENLWKRTGVNAAFKLDKAYGSFQVVK